jgi:hypothetical protein
MHNIDIFSNSHKLRTGALWSVCVLLMQTCLARSGADNNGHGARPIAMANAYVAIADDPWAVVYNPAGLSFVSSLHTSVFISPAQFGMKELRLVSVGAAIPSNAGIWGVVFDQYGFELYKETNAAFGFGRRLNEWISFGATIRITHVAIERYGNSTRGVMDIGGIALITDELRLGWSWMNATQTTIGVNSELLPEILSMGVCYEITEHSRLAAELEKDIRYPVIKKVGFEQDLFGALSLRLGLSDNPDRFSCGFGVRMAGCEFSYAGYSHQQLGWTHQVELSVTFGQ